MQVLIGVYNNLTYTGEDPTTFGIFHIICLAVLAALTFVACSVFKNSTDKTINKLTAIIWVTLVTLEVYKQVIYTVELDGAVVSLDYSWYAFPFQFCSSPLYILPIIAFTKREKLRNCCLAYMMSFSFFAGLAVMIYPNDVFTETLGINYQTMIHHGSQVLLGALYAVRYRQRMNKRFFLGGIKVFVVMVSVAMLMNVAVYRIFSVSGITETFNMFYISPHFECTLPVLSIVWDMVPYVAFVCCYFFGFILAALIVFSLLKALGRAVKGSSKPEVVCSNN